MIGVLIQNIQIKLQNIASHNAILVSKAFSSISLIIFNWMSSWKLEAPSSASSSSARHLHHSSDRWRSVTSCLFTHHSMSHTCHTLVPCASSTCSHSSSFWKQGRKSAQPNTSLKYFLCSYPRSPCWKGFVFLCCTQASAQRKTFRHCNNWDSVGMSVWSIDSSFVRLHKWNSS